MELKKTVVTLALVFMAVVCLQGIKFEYERQIAEAQAISEYNISERENAELSMQIQQKDYEDTMSRIVQHVAASDQYVNIGGGSKTPEYFDAIVFQQILNTASDNNFTEFLSNVELFFDKRKEYKDNLPNIWPLEYNPILRITSPDGQRYSPITGKIREHEGTDIASVKHAKVLATAPGRIAEHWYKHDIYGKLIVIDHENGYRTRYAHNSVTYVHERNPDGTPMYVERGDVIARTGTTGLTDGEHLHYEIQKWNEETQEWENVDAIPFMQKVLEKGNSVDKK